MLDEPFSAVDANLRADARHNVIAALESVGATAILVTHDQQEALGFGGLLGVLDRGALLQFATPEEIYDYPVSARVASLLGEAYFLDAVSDGHVARTAYGTIGLRTSGDITSPSGTCRLLLREGQVLVSAEGIPNAHVLRAVDEGHWTRLSIRPLGSNVPSHNVRVPRLPGAGARDGDRLRVDLRGTGYVPPQT